MANNSELNNLTAAEITNLWNAYMNDSGAVCHMKYQLNHVVDEEIKEILQNALKVSQSQINKIADILNRENYPIPHGFRMDEDVDVTAPRLFSDVYFLNTANQMGKIGLNYYSTSLRNSVRPDIFEYFNNCLKESVNLINQTNNVLLNKGIYLKTPYLPIPDNFDFVEEKGFLAGYFKEKRPLTGQEITNLYSNYERNALGAATMMGYSQSCKDKEVTEFFLKGKEIANKHCEIFGSFLKEHDIPSPMTWDSEVTDCTSYVYSDRKMMFYSTSLIALSISFYGESMATSPRRDIGAAYSRLIAELVKYADEGSRLMIKNGWMEEPPRSVDRDELAKKK